MEINIQKQISIIILFYISFVISIGDTPVWPMNQYSPLQGSTSPFLGPTAKVCQQNIHLNLTKFSPMILSGNNSIVYGITNYNVGQGDSIQALYWPSSKVIWKYSYPFGDWKAQILAISSDNNVLYLGTSNGFWCFDSQNGTVLWNWGVSKTYGNDFNVIVFLDNKKLFTAGYSNLYAFDISNPKSGSLLWHIVYKVKGEFESYDVTFFQLGIFNQNIVAFGTHEDDSLDTNSQIILFNIANGKLVDTYPAVDGTGFVIEKDSGAICLYSVDSCMCIDKNLNELWKVDCYPLAKTEDILNFPFPPCILKKNGNEVPIIIGGMPDLSGGFKVVAIYPNSTIEWIAKNIDGYGAARCITDDNGFIYIISGILYNYGLTVLDSKGKMVWSQELDIEVDALTETQYLIDSEQNIWYDNKVFSSKGC